MHIKKILCWGEQIAECYSINQEIQKLAGLNWVTNTIHEAVPENFKCRGSKEIQKKAKLRMTFKSMLLSLRVPGQLFPGFKETNYYLSIRDLEKP